MRVATLSEMLEEVVRLGEATGMEAHAHELRGELEGRLATIRAALAGASTPGDVGRAIVESLGVDPAPSRVVVGDMARYLIDLRRSSSDEEWDRTLETMYKRPVQKP